MKRITLQIQQEYRGKMYGVDAVIDEEQLKNSVLGRDEWINHTLKRMDLALDKSMRPEEYETT